MIKFLGNLQGNFNGFFSNNIIYSGVTTNELQITKIPANYNNFKYRVYITKNFNTCGKYSDFANLKVNPVPVLIPNLTLQQCDFDSDNVSDFNLNQKNSSISTNYLNEDLSNGTMLKPMTLLEKKAIDEALIQVANKQTISHELVMKETKKRYPKYFKNEN